MLAFGCDFLEGWDWLWLIPVLSKVGTWLQRRDSIVLAKQMDRSIVHNKWMAGMLRCRGSWIVKHVRKVFAKAKLASPIHPETPASNHGIFTTILPHFVFELLGDLGSVSSWTTLGKIFHLLTNSFKTDQSSEFHWKGQQSLCIPTTYAQKWVPSPVCWRVR